MRTNLDGNALFTAFEKFVSDQRNGTASKAVARIGEGEHMIVAAINDKVGPLWRRQSNKSVAKSLLDKASFAKKIGLSKANSVTNALKNGVDF